MSALLGYRVYEFGYKVKGLRRRVWGARRGLRRINVKWFRGGLVFKAHGLLNHSTLGLRVIKKKRRTLTGLRRPARARSVFVKLVKSRTPSSAAAASLGFRI